MVARTDHDRRPEKPILLVMASLSALTFATMLVYFVAVLPNRVAPGQGLSFGLNIMPTVAVAVFLVASTAMRARPVLAEGGGWVLALAGVLMALTGFVIGSRAFAACVLAAAGVGLALAGMCRWGVTIGARDRAVFVGAFTVGTVIGRPLWQLIPYARGSLFLAVTLTATVVTAVLAVMANLDAPPPGEWELRPAAVVTVMGVLTLLGVAFHMTPVRYAIAVGVSPRVDVDVVRVSTEGVGPVFALLVIVLLCAYAKEAGGAGLVGCVLLGMGLGPPLYLLATSAFAVRGDRPVVAVFGAAAGAGLAHLTRRAMPMQIVGLATAAIGVQMTIAALPGGGAAEHRIAMAFMGFGCAAALAAGLLSPPRRPHPYLGLGLGVAALVFTIQGIGHVALRGKQFPEFTTTVIPMVTAGAALLLLVVMWRRRRVTTTGDREGVGAAP